TSAGRAYLQIVESRRTGEQVRQQVIVTLGRYEDLQASGQLERLLRSGARFAALTETFVGDIEGGSPVRALQILRDDKSASLVSVQRFRGKLGGRQGTLVLQGSEIVQNGKIKARWFVVPGSGTGELPGSVARAALKATLEKDPMERWTIG